MHYQINDIEQLTGIKAHTIRIWEKRYNLISPFRTSTNIRYYDDDQVRRLLNISTLINAGRKISRIAALSDEELSVQVRELQFSESPQVAQSSYITSLTSAMIAFNGPEFDSLLTEVMNRYGTFEATTNVVYPFLVKVGVMWSTSELIPAQEHFASNLIRSKLITETASLPPAWRNDKKFLLFLPANEWHELGLLLCNFLVKHAGYPSVYLGASVPFSNVARTFEATQPTHLVSFYFAPRKKINIPGEFASLSEKIGTASLTVCGRSEMLEELSGTSSITRFTSVGDMVSFLNP
jgi:DNA-binding transcriptional MerR regulator